MVRKLSRVMVSPLVLTIGCYSGGSDGDPTDEEDPPVADGGDDGEPDDGVPAQIDDNGICVDTSRFFKEEIWTPLVSQKCLGCHNEQGEAKNTDFVMQMPDFPGYLEVNQKTAENISRLEIGGTPLLLLKPTGQTDHVGGKLFDVDSDEYVAMAEMIDRFAAPSHCVDDAEIEKFFTGLVEMSDVEALRKAAPLLADRAPTDLEIAQVVSGGVGGLDQVLDDMMEEEAFFQRLIVMFNDQFLTDAYLPGSNAIDTADESRFPNLRWYGDDTTMRNYTNDMIAREPLEMIAWVVKHHLPFSEIITGNYLVVSPFSARSYGIPLEIFADANDPNERQIWSFPDVPQSGMLTTSVFLNRYPSTPTNRNRHRSRVVYDFFLGVDIMRLASRPIDVDSNIGHNPTANNQQCTICHYNIDPLAGAFQNWSDEGWYRPPAEGWYPEMPPPGFGEIEIPYEDSYRSLSWLTSRIIDDPKFSRAVVNLAYEALTGQPPLLEPNEPTDADYLAKVRAFEAQDYIFKKIADKFVASNYELRVVFKEIIKSKYFKVVNATDDLSEDRKLELADMGTARLVPPELLHQRLVAATGYPWQKGGTNALLSTDYYLFFYGGLDSETVTTRLTEMNGVMASIVNRMANEMSCTVTALDFAKDPAARKLFPHVEMTDTPDMLGGEEKIKKNIEYLHGRLLGKVPDEVELERTYQLWAGVWEDGKAGLADPVTPYPTDLPGPCQATNDPIDGPIADEMKIVGDPDYTVRAWMAVMNYLLSDYEFLFD